MKMKNDETDFSFFESLPEGFLANAMARTTPLDVCRLSLVCSVFRSASEWDAVWEMFLPPDYQNILTESDGDGGAGSSTVVSKKELYLRLCDIPVIIDGGYKVDSSSLVYNFILLLCYNIICLFDWSSFVSKFAHLKPTMTK